MGKTEKKTEKKVATEKKPRKARAVMRSRKDSPAGHFADKLSAYAKQTNDVMAKVAKFPGVEEAKANGLVGVIDCLNQLAASGFVPAKGKGGNRGPSLTPGQRIYLDQASRDLLRPNFPAIDTTETYVSTSFVPAENTKTVPVRGGSADLDKGAWIGFVSKRSVSVQPAA